MNPKWFWLDFCLLPWLTGRPLQRARLVPPNLGTQFRCWGCWWFIFSSLIHHRRHGFHRDWLRLPKVAPHLKKCWSISFLTSFTFQGARSSVTLIMFFPFQPSHPQSLFCWCASPTLSWTCRRSAHKNKNKNKQKQKHKQNHCLHSNPFFQLSFAANPTTSLETTGLMCCKLSLQHWPKLSPNHMHHGLPHPHFLAVFLLLFGFESWTIYFVFVQYSDNWDLCASLGFHWDTAAQIHSNHI